MATYQALRDEIINYSRARRMWTDPNAMQVDAIRSGKAVAAAHGQTKAKVVRAAKASPRREARARRKMRNWPASLKVNAGTCQKKGKRSAEI